MEDLDGYHGDATDRPRDGGRVEGLRMMRASPLLGEAVRYWTSLRHGGDLPHRTDLDPARMTRLLGHAMILDRVRHGSVRVRLGGHVMQGIMGMDVRGLPMRAFFDLADRTRVAALIEEVFDGPQTLEMDLISDGPDGMITGRMVVLPLLDAGRRVTKALTVMVTDRAVTDGPRRFGLTNAVSLPVHGAVEEPRRRMTDLPLPSAPRPAAPQAGMAEKAAPYETRPSNVPWLRVVK